jgi:lipopolysaccharide transport system ATP-binding protein
MSAPVVFDGVWKKFNRGERHDSLRDLIPSLARQTFSRRSASELKDEEFWALREVSFEVKPGQALGIIGPNGAGKSTVLKLLTRILKPTRGSAVVRGRAGALIEVAAGFHPDLTGRENVYLQGAVMGMKRAEIARRFDEIIEFAGIGDFIDTQVKRYSSGMQARLGFSVAAHLEPEVLLIDEVLSVGDMRFQEKCLERMQNFRDSGVAIVFVSHNLSAISALCDTVLVLSSGHVVAIGSPHSGITAYAAMIQEVATQNTGDSAQLMVELLDGDGRPTDQINAGDSLTLRVFISPSRTAEPEPVISGMRIRSLETGNSVFFAFSTSLGCAPLKVPELHSAEIVWTVDANLARGHYSIEIVIFSADTMKVLRRIWPAAHFAIHENESHDGTAYLRARCAVRTTAPGAAAPDVGHATPLHEVTRL